MAKPVKFDKAENLIPASKREQYGELWVYRYYDEFFFGHLQISKWRLSWRERLAVLITGCIWVIVRSEEHPVIAIEGKTPAEVTGKKW